MKIEFSIITVAYNSKQDLIKTINSIQSQSYKKFDHIIKDGASNDNTNEIDFLNFKNTRFYTSSDTGIYDAMNQAIKYVKNEYIIFLNAGDIFFSKDTLLELSIKIKANPNFYSYFGGTINIEPETNKIVRIIGMSKLYKYLPLSPLPHPSFIIKKSVLTKLKYPFDPNLEIASDYKQQLTLRSKNLWKVHHFRQIITVMPLGGKSNKNKISILKGYIEIYKTSFKFFNIIALYIILLKLCLYLYSKINTVKFNYIKINY